MVHACGQQRLRAGVLHDLEIVRDEQVGKLLGRLQVHEQVHDLRLDRHVRRADNAGCERRYGKYRNPFGALGQVRDSPRTATIAPGEFAQWPRLAESGR